MPITGYLKVPDIDGESTRADHEGEIDVSGMSWGVRRQGKSARGAGRTSARARVSALSVEKQIDAASPYLLLAAMQGKAFDEIVLTIRKSSGEASFDYYTVTMTNCVLKAVEQANGGLEDPLEIVQEVVAIKFEKVEVRYVVQNNDGSAGTIHEIQYDIAAGV